MPKFVLVPQEGGGCGTSWTSRDKLDKSGQVGQVGTSWTSRDKWTSCKQVNKLVMCRGGL